MENSAFLEVEQSIRPIILDLMISRAAPQSKELASKIHHALIGGVIKKHHLKDRGIRPGLFYVLALAQRPSVLLEVGFLSNSQGANDHCQPTLSTGLRSWSRDWN